MKKSSYVYGRGHHHDDFARLFRSQLERLKTDCIDYYLIHCLIDTNEWENLCGLGIEKIPTRNFGAGNCKECGTCEKKCPQQIPVIKSLKVVERKMEPFWIKAILKIYFMLSG